MPANQDANDAVVQNLRDAGCDAKIIGRFLSLWEAGRIDDQLCLLAGYRKSLLRGIHNEQAKLDCLDYLIVKIRKGGDKTNFFREERDCHGFL